MEATELTVIDEATSEASLPQACPSCDGKLSVRLSPDGIYTFCMQCHLVGRASLETDEDGGTSLQLLPSAKA